MLAVWNALVSGQRDLWQACVWRDTSGYSVTWAGLKSKVTFCWDFLLLEKVYPTKQIPWLDGVGIAVVWYPLLSF